jgi:hypothetical protein
MKGQGDQTATIWRVVRSIPALPGCFSGWKPAAKNRAGASEEGLTSASFADAEDACGVVRGAYGDLGLHARVLTRDRVRRQAHLRLAV